MLKKQSILFKLLVVLIIQHGCFCSLWYAQGQTIQPPYLGEYYWQSLLYNPCFAGNHDLPTIAFSGRLSSENTRNPYTLNGFAHGRIDSLHSGFGISATYHRYDDTYYFDGQNVPTDKRYLLISGLYNYEWRPSDDLGLKVGVAASALHYQTYDPPIYGSGGGQTVVALNERKFKLNLNFGLLAQWKNLQAGLSFEHINKPVFQFTQPGTQHRFQNTLYTHLAYKWVLGDRWLIQPSAMGMWVISNQSFGGAAKYVSDFNLLLFYNKVVFTGVSYRLNEDPYFLAISAGARLGGQIQLSGAVHLVDNSFANYKPRYEATIGFYLWNNEEYEEGSDY